MDHVFYVTIEKNGTRLTVGRITGESSTDASFSYAESYLKSPDAAPISLSLPLKTEPFSADMTRKW